jgi:hypothetical protein
MAVLLAAFTAFWFEYLFAPGLMLICALISSFSIESALKLNAFQSENVPQKSIACVCC